MFRALHYVFVTAAVYAVRTGTDVTDLCNPSPCVLNSKCVIGRSGGNRRATCPCVDNFYGNGFEKCTPECIHDSDCTKNRHCQNNGCGDPCIDGSSCGQDAFCYVENHEAVCSCHQFFVGDPYSKCFPDPCISKPCGTGADCKVRANLETATCVCPTGFNVEHNVPCNDDTILGLLDQALAATTGNLCTPTTCGIGANCAPGQDDFGNVIAKCTCPLYYIGNPNVVCQKGVCIYNNDCLDQFSCDNFLCKNPCDGVSACAKYAACEVELHEAVCSCPRGYHGDAKEKCTFIPLPEAPIETIVTEAPIEDSTISPSLIDTVGSDEAMTYAEAKTFCHNYNGMMFRPVTNEDWTFLQNYIKTRFNDLWLPFTNLNTEGTYQWDIGAALTRKEENEIPWYRSNLYDEMDPRDLCGILYHGTLFGADCNYKSAGVLCRLKNNP